MIEQLRAYFDQNALPAVITMPPPIMAVHSPQTFVERNLASIATYAETKPRLVRAHIERVKMVIEQMGGDFDKIVGAK